jgi:parallel beta-helix repeat protein
LKTTGISVTSNIVYDNGASGIDIGTGVNNAIVEQNTVYNNTWSADFIHQAGIHFWGNQVDGNNLTVKYNESYGNAGTGNWGRGNGLHLDEVGSNVVVAYNRFHDNHDVGIFVENSKNVQIYYNLVYHNSEDGILVFRSCSGNKIYNNVAYGNKYGVSIRGNGANAEMLNNVTKNNISSGNIAAQLVAVYGGENDGARGSGNVYEYNCLGIETPGFIEWGAGIPISNYRAWETSYGKSTYSVKGDPLLTDPSNGNFSIGSGSPCIDSGANVGVSVDYVGTTVPRGSGTDIGAFEWLGATLLAPKNLRSIPSS